MTFLIVFPTRCHHFQYDVKAGPIGIFLLGAGQVVDNFQVRFPAGLGRFLGVGFEIVNHRDAVQQIELPVGVVLEAVAHVNQPCRRDFNPFIERLQVRAGNLVTKLRLQRFVEVVFAHCFRSNREGFQMRFVGDEGRGGRQLRR